MAKGLYALGAMSRNSARNRRLLFASGGLEALQDVVSQEQLAPAIVRRALNLLADIARPTAAAAEACPMVCFPALVLGWPGVLLPQESLVAGCSRPWDTPK